MAEDGHSTSEAESAEQRVGRLLRQGLAADFGHVSQDRVADRTIRAEFVRELLFQCVTNSAIAPVGVAITRAKIEGDLSCLNFGSSAAPLPVLDLSFSEITGDVDLTDSCFSSVALDNCSLRGLTARWLNVGNGLRAENLSFTSPSAVLINLEGLTSAGDVKLTQIGRRRAANRVLAPCRLRLKQARIGGTLDLSGSLLEMPSHHEDAGKVALAADSAALQLDGAEIGGRLVLEVTNGHRFEAKGGAQLAGVKIGDQLSCLGARFESERTEALVLDRIRTANSVFLAEAEPDALTGQVAYRFEAVGEVLMMGARVGGQLACTGASFKNPGNDALSLDRTEIDGSLFLEDSKTNRFEVDGATRLVGIKVGGQLSLRGARLSHPIGTALSLSGAEVGSHLILRKSDDHVFRAEGTIRLDGARIGSSFDCVGRVDFPTEAKPDKPTPPPMAFNFENLFVGHTFKVRLDEASSGEVWLRGARVGSLDDDVGRGWGAPPTKSPSQGLTGIQLRLDGFVYERLGGPQVSDRLNGSVVDLPTNQIWKLRIKWLEKQIRRTAAKPNDYFPQPHEQLSKVLRLMGHDVAARHVACHKSQHEWACRASTWPMAGLMWVYRTFFGAGYLPLRALLTVLGFWLLGTALTCVALSLNSPDHIVLARSVPPVELVRWLGAPDVAPVSPTPGVHDKKVGDRMIYAPHAVVQARDVPCTEIRPPLYALDVMVPFVGLHVADKCEMSDHAPAWIYGKAIYEIVGWLIVALAALTWSGVLRKEAN